MIDEDWSNSNVIMDINLVRSSYYNLRVAIITLRDSSEHYTYMNAVIHQFYGNMTDPPIPTDLTGNFSVSTPLPIFKSVGKDEYSIYDMRMFASNIIENCKGEKVYAGVDYAQTSKRPVVNILILEPISIFDEKFNNNLLASIITGLMMNDSVVDTKKEWFTGVSYTSVTLAKWLSLYRIKNFWIYLYTRKFSIENIGKFFKTTPLMYVKRKHVP